MATIKILTKGELESAVPLDAAAVDCIEDAFRTLATEDVVMPPIMRMDIHEHNGEIDVKTAYVPGLDSFAIKMAPGFFDNPKLGLPSGNGLMILFSAKTGMVEALLLDNGYLTEVRTAAAGGVAAKHLARADARTAAVLGGGLQARLQLQALALVRPIERARIWARRPAQAAETAAALAEEMGIEVTPAESAESAVDGADIIVTATPSDRPVLMADWLQPGQHVTAMGSDAEHKQELEAAALTRADLYVSDRQSQCAVLGELHHAIDAGLIAADATLPELGQVVAGTTAGRTGDDQITIADLTGTGLQDTAIATLARQRCAAAGVGTDFET